MKRIRRETRETQITVGIRRGSGPGSIRTDEPFLTHMVQTLGRYAGLEIEMEATGDLRHHLIEDVAITLGAAIRELVPDHAARFGDAVLPMDDALVLAAIDVGGRPWYSGRLPSPLYQHFLQSLAFHLGATLHIKVLRGRDRHHVVEAAVKATGLALRQALATHEDGAVFSTKGSVGLVHLEDGG